MSRRFFSMKHNIMLIRRLYWEVFDLFTDAFQYKFTSSSCTNIEAKECLFKAAIASSQIIENIVSCLDLSDRTIYLLIKRAAKHSWKRYKGKSYFSSINVVPKGFTLGFIPGYKEILSISSSDSFLKFTKLLDIKAMS